ncbi:hypothetical protein BDD21_4176 [Thiocapsa rosea]|uniref:Uncharacterized protein n=1 Tax=Thiocapsa rosea TaxID=69360 RepID=A0A495VE52_9GAMM|nr:hypothetical protein BDD21_4176 [Thiocapsa rosea]
MIKIIAGILLLFILPFTINAFLSKITMPISIILAIILMSKIK